MSRRFLYCLLRGQRFSPARARERTGLVLVDANEPGEVAPSRRYDGQAHAEGSALVVLLDEDVPELSLRDGLRGLGEALPVLRGLGVTQALLSLVVAYEGTCDFSLTPEELAALGALGLPLEVSCHPAAT